MKKLDVQTEVDKTWECEDSDKVLNYSVKQNTTKFSLEGQNLPTLNLTVQAQTKEDNKGIAYDYLSIGRYDNNGTLKEDFELLLQDREIADNENSNIELIESIELNGTVFTDLYRNIEGENIYYYSSRYGLIGFSYNDKLFTIEPCKFPGYPDPSEVDILPESVAQTGYHNQSGSLSFTNLGGQEVNYNIENKELTYVCFYEWICPRNPLYGEAYSCERLTVTTDLITTDGATRFCISTILRHNTYNPFAYSDVLSIGIHKADEVFWPLSFVINPRTDETANNDDLDFHNLITLNGMEFESVYVNKITEDNPYKIYYKLGTGIIAYENTESDGLFVLN